MKQPTLSFITVFIIAINSGLISLYLQDTYNPIYAEYVDKNMINERRTIAAIYNDHQDVCMLVDYFDCMVDVGDWISGATTDTLKKLTYKVYLDEISIHDSYDNFEYYFTSLSIISYGLLYAVSIGIALFIYDAYVYIVPKTGRSEIGNFSSHYIRRQKYYARTVMVLCAIYAMIFVIAFLVILHNTFQLQPLVDYGFKNGARLIAVDENGVRIKDSHGVTLSNYYCHNNIDCFATMKHIQHKYWYRTIHMFTIDQIGAYEPNHNLVRRYF